jgi:RNA polymerase sigma-70 factor (ECF subfamily)
VRVPRQSRRSDRYRAEAILADAVGLALLVVLDRLDPVERLAFVLRDMFAIPFEEIGTVVGRSPAARASWQVELVGEYRARPPF